MIDMLSSTGMRVGELVHLNRQDINFEERQCVVFGKGSKERLVYFNARTKIFQSLTGKFLDLDHEDIFQSLTGKSPIRLSWTHYSIILQEPTAEGRAWYEEEAAREMWGTRTLQRNVSSQYYHRLLQSQNKALVHDEMQKLTAPLQDKLEFLKSPVVAEFLGFKNEYRHLSKKIFQDTKTNPQ